MDIYKILKKYFGYDSFRQGQELLINAILSGRDVLGIMPTGAGKSLCYQVPALMLPGITIVISPLISLMKDQVRGLNEAGVHAAYINSSLSEGQIRKALYLAAEGQYKIIYVAPERLSTFEFMQFAQSVEISMVTVDEAHCISQWGQDFRPSYLKIVEFISCLEKRPIVSAFTATATEQVKEDMLCVLGLREPEILITGFDRRNLYFSVETAGGKDAYVLDYVKNHPQDSGIIYCATRKNTDKVYEKLKAEGMLVSRYHAGLSDSERKQSQEDFIYDRSLVMVATNAFGMGIDKSDVRYVIHYNMPQSMENYYQEAGRAGRDGENAECILLYSSQDLMINRFLLENKENRGEFTYEEMAATRERDEDRLRAMSRYCQTKHCLRHNILRYFGEKVTGDCGNCSNCQKEYEEVDVTREALEVVSCIQSLGQRYGINVVAGTLAGSQTAKLREYGVMDNPCYGALKELHITEIKEIIREMELAEYIYATKDKYALLKVALDTKKRLEQQHFYIKRGKEQPKKKSDKKVTQAMRRSDILNSKGLELFEQLRALRTAIAREENVPPYLVWSDKTLTDMCVKTPSNKEEMLAVHGVGENKFQKYGERFLAAIAEFSNGVPEKYYFGELSEVEAGINGVSSKNMDSFYTEERKHVTVGGKKEAFYLTKEQAKQFPFRERYLSAELAVSLNELRDERTTLKTSGAAIFRRLQEKNLATEQRIDGKFSRTVTSEGREFGLVVGTRVSQKGTEYEDIYYTELAQKNILAWFVREDDLVC